MAERGMLFTISGPAGVGKGTIVKELIRTHENVAVSVSCTTRAPRPGEENGREYHFVSEEEFTQMVENDQFYEWAYVHLNRYGTPKTKIAEMLDAGKDVILEIDVQGSLNVMEKNPEIMGIFILPPSGKNLEARLRGRNTENEEAIRVRLKNAVGEMGQAKKYQYCVVHQDWNENPNALQEAVADVYAIMRAAHCKTEQNIKFIENAIETMKEGY